MVIGLPKITFSKGVCQGCILGKHLEHKYERTSTPLELINSDISGPFPHISIIQAKYPLTFIDEFSRYCLVYFLKHKFEFFDLFKVFKALVKNQFGRRLKIPISDNGGECVKSKFIQYCKYIGICSIQSLTHHNKMVLLGERTNH